MAVPALDDAQHREADELLPWLLNGSLEGDERHRVEQHLVACPACRDELSRLQGLRALLTEDDSQASASLGWRRLQDRLRASEAPAGAQADAAGWTDARAPRPRAQTPPPRLRWRHRMLPAAAGWRGLMVAQTVAIVMLLGAWLLPASDGERGLASYRSLSAAPAAPGATAMRASITVVLDGSVTEHELRALLLSLPASVVEGPSPEGAYGLAVAPAALATALGQLRAHPGVRLAEPTVYAAASAKLAAPVQAGRSAGASAP